MTDIELAEEIERHISYRPSGFVIPPYSLYEADAKQIIAALRRGPERPPSGEMVMAFLEQFKAASEERWQFLNECEREAAKYRTQGDMWGWNFHMGMSSGANQADLMYQRVYRAMLSAAEASKEAK